MKCPRTPLHRALQRGKLEEMLAVSLLSLLAFPFNPLQKEWRSQKYTPFHGWGLSGFPSTIPPEPPGLAGKQACRMRDGSGHSNQI